MVEYFPRVFMRIVSFLLLLTFVAPALLMPLQASAAGPWLSYLPPVMMGAPTPPAKKGRHPGQIKQKKGMDYLQSIRLKSSGKDGVFEPDFLDFIFMSDLLGEDVLTKGKGQFPTVVFRFVLNNDLPLPKSGILKIQIQFYLKGQAHTTAVGGLLKRNFPHPSGHAPWYTLDDPELGIKKEERPSPFHEIDLSKIVIKQDGDEKYIEYKLPEKMLLALKASRNDLGALMKGILIKGWLNGQLIFYAQRGPTKVPTLYWSRRENNMPWYSGME